MKCERFCLLAALLAAISFGMPAWGQEDNEEREQQTNQQRDDSNREDASRDDSARVESNREDMDDEETEYRGMEHAALGVMLSERTGRGVRIRDLLSGSPAERAGLRPGDTILKIDEKPMKSYSDVVRFINRVEPGQEAEITINRDGEEKTIDVRFASHEEIFGSDSDEQWQRSQQPQSQYRYDRNQLDSYSQDRDSRGQRGYDNRPFSTGQYGQGQAGSQQHGQYDQQQYDQRQYDQRQSGQRQLDQRQMDQRQLNDRQFGQRQMDQRQMDGRQMDQRQWDRRQMDQRQMDQRQFDQRQLGQRQYDDRPYDRQQAGRQQYGSQQPSMSQQYGSQQYGPGRDDRGQFSMRGGRFDQDNYRRSYSYDAQYDDYGRQYDQGDARMRRGADWNQGATVQRQQQRGMDSRQVYQQRGGAWDGESTEQWGSRQQRDQGVLGIDLDDRSGNVVVHEVWSNSPAERAGLRRGDEIVAVDDEDVRTQDDLLDELQNCEPGDRVKLTIQRNGEERTISARLVSQRELSTQSRTGRMQSGSSQSDWRASDEDWDRDDSPARFRQAQRQEDWQDR